MKKTTHIIFAHALIALFLVGCVRACDAEYANQQKQIEEWKFEQTYISPTDQMIIDFRNGETK